MESILSGAAQYIIASINMLITIAQSTYIMNLEHLTAKRITEIETKKITGNINRYKANWHILLLAWWLLAGMAILTLAFRIIPTLFVGDQTEKYHPWFISIDFIIIVGTLSGYLLLASLAFRAWKWNKWQGKSEPK